MHGNNPLRNGEAGAVGAVDDVNGWVENLRVISMIGCALATFWGSLAIVMLGLDLILLQWQGNHTLAQGAIGLAVAAGLGLTCAVATAACTLLPWRNPCTAMKDAARNLT